MKTIELSKASWKQITRRAKELEIPTVGFTTNQLIGRIKSKQAGVDTIQVEDEEVAVAEKPKATIKPAAKKTEKKEPAAKKAPAVKKAPAEKKAPKEKKTAEPAKPKMSLAIKIWNMHLSGADKKDIAAKLKAVPGFVYNVIRAYTASEHLQARAKEATK